MNERPLVWTTRGNLPIEDLKYESFWEIGDGFVKFSELYRDAEGAIVKESAHVYSKFGVTGEAVATSF